MILKAVDFAAAKKFFIFLKKPLAKEKKVCYNTRVAHAQMNFRVVRCYARMNTRYRGGPYNESD